MKEQETNWRRVEKGLGRLETDGTNEQEDVGTVNEWSRRSRRLETERGSKGQGTNFWWMRKGLRRLQADWTKVYKGMRGLETSGEEV